MLHIRGLSLVFRKSGRKGPGFLFVAAAFLRCAAIENLWVPFRSEIVGGGSFLFIAQAASLLT
jgi:hypothetical protein